MEGTSKWQDGLAFFAFSKFFMLCTMSYELQSLVMMELWVIYFQEDSQGQETMYILIKKKSQASGGSNREGQRDWSERERLLPARRAYSHGMPTSRVFPVSCPQPCGLGVPAFFL